MICRECKKEVTGGYRKSIICPNCLKIHRSTRHRNLKLEVLTAYGLFCRCCNEAQYEFLTIDHINPELKLSLLDVGGTLYRRLKKANYPPGFQTLCWNCNTAKHYYGVCPHEIKRRHEALTADHLSN